MAQNDSDGDGLDTGRATELFFGISLMKCKTEAEQSSESIDLSLFNEKITVVHIHLLFLFN